MPETFRNLPQQSNIFIDVIITQLLHFYDSQNSRTTVPVDTLTHSVTSNLVLSLNKCKKRH